MNLLDSLQERGFIPDDGGTFNFDCFDLTVGTQRRVRVAVDDTEVIVYMLDRFGVVLWHARLLDTMPGSIIAAVIDLAIASAYTANGDTRHE
jgi:hypothetical protein